MLKCLRIFRRFATVPGTINTLITPDIDAITKFLRCCSRFPSNSNGRSVHAWVIKLGLFGDVFLTNNLIGLYGDLCFYADAQMVFDEMPVKNVASWTTLISLHNHAGEPDEAIRMFNQMLNCAASEPNSYTYSTALKACSMIRDIQTGKWIHQHITRAGLLSDNILMNALLDMYVKSGDLDEARKVFDGMFSRNLTSYNTMIVGYCRANKMDEAENLFRMIPEPDVISFNTIISGFAQIESSKALDYFKRMHRNGVELDRFSFPGPLNISGSLGYNEFGEQLHGYIIKYGSESQSFTCSSLILMYSKCGQIKQATILFNIYSNSEFLAGQKVLLWNSMVSGYASNNFNNAALALVSEMHKWGAGLDSYALSSALTACINMAKLQLGLQIHGLIVTSGYRLDHIVGCVLLSLYSKCGNLDDSLRVFASLSQKDVITWAAQITGCVHQGCIIKALYLFKKMVSLSIALDHFVISIVLKACSLLPGFEFGKQVHGYSIKRGLDSESVTVTSLIDMYSKYGEIESSLLIFESAEEKDIVCWTGIIVGCGFNGRATESIRFFEEMLSLGAKPNEITFLGVLTACRHGGLVEEASKYFNLMVDNFGLKPGSEHYCCMVDILTQAGWFREAKQFASSFPYEAAEKLPNSFLGALMNYQNPGPSFLELMHQGPVSKSDTSVNVALSNIYASIGSWDCSAKLRDFVRVNRMKEPGRSWLQVRAF